MKYLKRIISQLRGEKGVALPLVLIVMVVLLLLGSGLYAYSISELNQAAWVESRSRAHYLARVGTESAAKTLLRNSEMIATIRSEVSVGESIKTPEDLSFESDFFDEDEEFSVEITRVEENKMEIIGTGYANDVTQSVKIMLEGLEPFDGLFYALGTGMDTLKFESKTTINGDIVTGCPIVEPNPIDNHDGEITPGEERFYPVPIFPNISKDGSEKLDVKNNEIKPINSNPTKGYSEIGVHNNGELHISIGSDGDIEILVDKIDSGGLLRVDIDIANNIIMEITGDSEIADIDIYGDGKFIIYLHPEKKLEFNAGTITIHDDAVFIVYLGDLSELSLANKAYFEGYVYGPTGNVTIENSAHFVGAMIVDKLEGSGNSGIGGPHTTISNENEDGTRVYNFATLDDVDMDQHWISYWSD